MNTIFRFFLDVLAAMFNLLMPNLISHTWTTTVKSNLGAVGSATSFTVSGDAEENCSPNGGVAAGSIVDEIIAPINCDDLVSFAIESDKDITLKFNARSGPASPSPISLKAGKAYAWNNTMNTTNPLAGLVLSKVIFDNSAGSATAAPKAVFLMSVGS